MATCTRVVLVIGVLPIFVIRSQFLSMRFRILEAALAIRGGTNGRQFL